MNKWQHASRYSVRLKNIQILTIINLESMKANEAMENSILIQLQKDSKKIKQLARKHGAKTVSVFGSVARREDQPNSDIDLLVEFEESASLFDLINLKLELEEIYNRKVDIVTLNSLHKKIVAPVMNEAIQL